MSVLENNSNSMLPQSLSEFKDLIEKTDDDGTVQIYSYKFCENTSPDILKKYRGVVFSGETSLFSSLGYTEEYNENDKDIVSTKGGVENFSFFRSEEGTLIRLFYTNKWYISTNRKLDAFHSRWGTTTSFGEIFKNALHHLNQDEEKLFERLDKNHVYFFLIRNIRENRIVCAPSSHPIVFHVGTLLNGKTFDLTIDTGIPKQDKLMFESWDGVFSHVQGVDHLDCQGVIVFYEDGTQFKIINAKYQLYSQVRGNEASLNFRYLQVRNNPTYIRLIHELYPDNINNFVLYENTIAIIAKQIHNAYIKRFVNKNQVVVSKEEYRIIRECHGWHISDREKNKVTLNVVLRVLGEQRYYSTLNTLIKRHKKGTKVLDKVVDKIEVDKMEE